MHNQVGWFKTTAEICRAGAVSGFLPPLKGKTAIGKPLLIPDRYIVIF
jgi:hypothetical protein